MAKLNADNAEYQGRIRLFPVKIEETSSYIDRLPAQ